MIFLWWNPGLLSASSKVGLYTGGEGVRTFLGLVEARLSAVARVGKGEKAVAETGRHFSEWSTSLLGGSVAPVTIECICRLTEESEEK